MPGAFVQRRRNLHKRRREGDWEAENNQLWRADDPGQSDSQDRIPIIRAIVLFSFSAVATCLSPVLTLTTGSPAAAYIFAALRGSGYV
jgi:hypothetical protein